jgi:hypothetical protein
MTYLTLTLAFLLGIALESLFAIRDRERAWRNGWDVGWEQGFEVGRKYERQRRAWWGERLKERMGR